MAQTVGGFGMAVFNNADVLGGLASKVFKGNGTKAVLGNAGINVG